MPTWTLQPRDPLIARDGRPFTAEPGARARSLAVPPPSLLAGAWRSRVGRGPDGAFDSSGENLARLLAQPVTGPLLVELGPDGEIRQWGAPPPLDAVLFGEERPVRRRALVPRALQADEACNLPEGLGPLAFSGAETPEKPCKSAPSLWTWNAFASWLSKPEDGPWSPEWAFDGPLAEERTHVALSLEGTGTAAEGALFSTEGRRYRLKDRSLALALRVGSDEGMEPGYAPVGGERRLARWDRSQVEFPAPPAGLFEAIARAGACRIILLTPGHFEAGWRPAGLLEGGAGVRVELAAAATGRPEVHSGWDLHRGRPKPTRRAVRAGSVYFLRLQGEEAAIRAWAEAQWMACTSDREQDRLDGWGLAVPGTWTPEGGSR